MDAATIHPSLDGSDPPYTISQKGVTSRIDLCLLNTSAMNLFWDFEQWNHERCTIPNHKLQCVTLKLGGRKQFALKPSRPYTIPDFENLRGEDSEQLSSDLIEEHIDDLSQAFEEEDVEKYWVTWCRLAEGWLLHHCAFANADPAIISDARYKGRGQFNLSEECVNLKQKEVNDEGCVVDPRLASALKIRRILDEVVTKLTMPRNYGTDLEIFDLWQKASRIAWSDCKVIQTEVLRSSVEVPGRERVKTYTE